MLETGEIERFASVGVVSFGAGWLTILRRGVVPIVFSGNLFQGAGDHLVEDSSQSLDLMTVQPQADPPQAETGADLRIRHQLIENRGASVRAHIPQGTSVPLDLPVTVTPHSHFGLDCRASTHVRCDV
jgi:hypothetical protein